MAALSLLFALVSAAAILALILDEKNINESACIAVIVIFGMLAYLTAPEDEDCTAALQGPGAVVATIGPPSPTVVVV
jgi:hypothetical protein